MGAQNKILVLTLLSGAVATAPRPAAIPHPAGYVCVRATAPIAVDGSLGDPAWRAAPWSGDFGDMATGVAPAPSLQTRMKLLWDDQYLYVAAEIAGPDLWAEMTKHDSPLYQENAFEFFIDPDGDNHEYYEFEINARNTTWDLFLPRPYRDGGQGISDWEIVGLQSAVRLDGTLNDPADVDKGWTIEIAVPWFALGEQAHRPVPPHPGDQWRMNFTRVETPLRREGGTYRKIDRQPSRVFSWARQYVMDIHRPETWGYVQFETASRPFVPDPSWPARRWLRSAYDAQREYQKIHGRWAVTRADLGLPSASDAGLRNARIETTRDLFEACVQTDQGEWCVRQDSLIWKRGRREDGKTDEKDRKAVSRQQVWMTPIKPALRAAEGAARPGGDRTAHLMPAVYCLPFCFFSRLRSVKPSSEACPIGRHTNTHFGSSGR